MSAYTEILEFFMENGIQVNANQMESIRDIVDEATVNDVQAMKKTLKSGNLKEDDARRVAAAVGKAARKSDDDKAIDKAKDRALADVFDRARDAAYKENDKRDKAEAKAERKEARSQAREERKNNAAIERGVKKFFHNQDKDTKAVQNALKRMERSSASPSLG